MPRASVDERGATSGDWVVVQAGPVDVSLVLKSGLSPTDPRGVWGSPTLPDRA